MPLKRQFGFITGALVIVASMVGGGLFYLPNSILELSGGGWQFLALFLVGGLIAIAGSLSYAELASMIPEDGGEYQFLKRIFGHLPAFLTGWISLLVGFTAPIAGAALTMKYYLIPLCDSLIGPNHLFHNEFIFKGSLSVLIAVLGSIHIIGVKFGSSVQNILTVIKIGIVLSFIIFGFIIIGSSEVASSLNWSSAKPNTGGVFELSSALILVMYVYSGWNGATYIGGEMKDPEKNLPKALFWGTFITMTIYILINVAFIAVLSPEKMAGNPGFGPQFALKLFGPQAGNMYNFFIIVILMSSISAQLMIGPRVYYKMAQDRVIFHSLAKVNDKTNTPIFSILIQILLSVLYVFFVPIDDLFTYMSFALNLFPILTVIGLLYWRSKHPEKSRPYKVFAYPITPIFFIILSTGMMIFSVMNGFKEKSLVGHIIAFAVVLSGVPYFYLWKYWLKRKRATV